MDFAKRYAKLNDNQRLAVDTIDGPVMVVAGPGTGKTELLSMRAANILKKTDVLPENILCLTFTEAGSLAMQRRLTEIVGRDAYNISVCTFHAFGTSIMNRYREHFYQGAEFRPADELARHRIITEILDSLDYDNPLCSKMNGTYTAINDILTAISDLKRASLTDAEFGLLLDETQLVADVAQKHLGEVFSGRVTAAVLEPFSAVIEPISDINETRHVIGIPLLKDVLSQSILHAVSAAQAHEKTTPPVTEWKKQWMTTGHDKRQTLKVHRALPKLRALNHVYGLYLQIMEKAALYDFDDMIMQVVHAMEVNDELRFDLQEKYQYIMVDEFQDTNLAQMRILHNLTNNPVVEGNPNILVVGDDDQAIYGFQGADVSNILTFKDTYPTTTQITLTDNYRSVQPVLDSAREIIIQSHDRLETRIAGLDKTLRAHHESHPVAKVTHFPQIHDERQSIAHSIKSLVDRGVRPQEIAVIARKHSDLVALISYLTENNLPISYDRRDNVLDDEVIIQLELTSRIIHAISVGDHDIANALLPKMMSHPAWGIEPKIVWQISLSSYRSRGHWLETMHNHDATKPLFNWIISLAQQAQHLPLERMIDQIIGNTSPHDDYISPLKSYFFPDMSDGGDVTEYTRHLQNLSTIRTKLREHNSDTTSPRLVDFLEFIRQCKETNTWITSYRHIGEDTTSIRLLTAHGSKGLEYEHVFVVNATDAMWGEKASGKSSTILFPPHLRLRQNTNDYDERLRLFYVAMTRAKQGLYVSYSDENDSGKETLPAAFLIGSSLERQQESSQSGTIPVLHAAEHIWYEPLINIPRVTMEEYLAPILQDYKLSATHVNTFIDVSEGGPQHLLLNTLLRFPHARTAAADYGVAIHTTLQRAHDHIRSSGQLLPEEDILHEFEKNLARMPLTDDEHHRYLQKGSDALRLYLKEHHEDFRPTQFAEMDFRYQEVVVDSARLTGKLDVIEFDQDAMTAIVTDYKTGGALTSWDKGQDYQKIKAHKYRQQLLFYKLLVEHSRDWRKYRMSQGVLQFVEPDKAGQIVDLRLDTIDEEEYQRFKKLVGCVWKHIHELSFPDTSQYEKSIKGIRAFEDDLLTKL